MFGNRRCLENLLRVILRLGIPQPAVQPTCRQKLLMASLLRNFSLLKYQNAMAEMAAGKTVGNINRPLVLRKPVHPLINIRLRHRIQSCRRLVQYHIGRVLVQAPGNGHLLGLSAGQLHPVLGKALEQLRIQPFRQCLEPLAEACVLQSQGHLILVVLALHRHVLPQPEGKDLVILEHRGEKGQIFLVLVFSDIHVV